MPVDVLAFGAYAVQFLITFIALAYFEVANHKFVAGEFQRFVHSMAAAVVGFFLGTFFLFLQVLFPPGPFASLMTFLVGFCFALTSILFIRGALLLLDFAKLYGFAAASPARREAAKPLPALTSSRKRKKR